MAIQDDLLPDLPPSTPPRRVPGGAEHPPGWTPSWFIPLAYFLEREETLRSAGVLSGPFNLDPCGHAEAPVSVEILRRGGRVYTAEDDGLRQDWRGCRPFLNPPFDSESMRAFIRKAVYGRFAYGMELALHCPAWTDRRWWHESVEPDRRAGRAVVWFEEGRLTYGWPGNPTGAGGETATFASALVWWPR